VQLAGEQELDAVVIGGGLDQQPFLADRPLLGQQGVLHGEGGLRRDEAPVLCLAGGGKGADRCQQADRPVLEQIPDREPPPSLVVGELEHHAKPCLEQARDRAFVGSALDPFEKVLLLAGTQR